MEQIHLQMLEQLIRDEEATIVGSQRKEKVSDDMHRAIEDTRDKIRMAFEDSQKPVKAKLKDLVSNN